MDWIERAADWAGVRLEPAQRRLLEKYRDWLREEAIPAGGLGPNEADRLDQRHLADSLLFAGGWRREAPPSSVLDLGSGVGLPGIPLAIIWPQSRVTLLDRAGRRVQLARRAVRVLGLQGVAVVQGEAEAGDWQAQLVVARAVSDPATVLAWARRVLEPGGVAVVGGSHQEVPAVLVGEEIIEIPAEILDHRIWLRIMAAA